MSDAAINKKDFEPRIVAFFCNWCTYTAADLAGTARMKYAANVRVIRMMCSGRLDPQFVFSALRVVRLRCGCCGVRAPQFSILGIFSLREAESGRGLGLGTLPEGWPSLELRRRRFLKGGGSSFR